MAQLSEDVIAAIEDPQSVKMLATADKQKSINMVPIGSIKVVDEETLAYACFFAGKTKRNIETTRQAAIVIFQPPLEGYQVKGRFLKWETAGDIYDQVTIPVVEQLKSMGLSLTPQAVGIIKVTEAYALSLPIAGEKIA
ncbi:MAG TPA: hypothetical protein DCK87_07250 [Desulfotomaculum sp.]|nr:hypothetical protein [Desulfotomaculum sp.]